MSHPEPERRFAKNHGITKMKELKDYPDQPDHFTDGETEFWRQSG